MGNLSLVLMGIALVCVLLISGVLTVSMGFGTKLPEEDWSNDGYDN